LQKKETRNVLQRAYCNVQRAMRNAQQTARNAQRAMRNSQRAMREAGCSTTTCNMRGLHAEAGSSSVAKPKP
jgi:signal transduction histidine kinase